MHAAGHLLVGGDHRWTGDRQAACRRTAFAAGIRYGGFPCSSCSSRCFVFGSVSSAMAAPSSCVIECWTEALRPRRAPCAELINRSCYASLVERRDLPWTLSDLCLWTVDDGVGSMLGSGRSLSEWMLEKLSSGECPASPADKKLVVTAHAFPSGMVVFNPCFFVEQLNTYLKRKRTLSWCAFACVSCELI